MQGPRVPSAVTVGSLYLVSGAAALVHEVSWTRVGQGLLGGDARAVAVVLVAILGGMGLGGLLAPVASRRWGALGAFVRVEAVGAIFALAIPWTAPALDALLGFAFRSLGGGPAFTLASAVVATLLFTPPALAMGAGLPLLAQVRAPAGRTPRDAGGLYAVHALGGAGGGLVAAFFLLPALDVTLTVCIASVLQLGVAVIASALPSHAASERRAERRSSTASRAPGAIALLLSAALLAGLSTAALQTLWTRLATVAIGPSTKGFALVAAVYVLALAIGAAVAAPLVRKVKNPVAAYAILMLGAAVAAVFGIETVGGWSASGDRFALELAIPVFIPVALTAAAFPFGVATLARFGRRRVARDVGWLVAAGATGNIFGVVIATFALVPALGLAPSLVTAAGALVVAALLAASAGFKGGPGRPPLKTRHAGALLALCVLGVVGLSYTPRQFSFEVGEPEQTDGRVVFVHHGVDATVAVHETDTDRLLWVDGRIRTRSAADAPAHLLSGLIPALLSDVPAEALVIGLGTGTTADAVRAVPGVERVEVAELVDGVRWAAPYFRDQNTDVLSDERVEIRAVAGPLLVRHGDRSYGVIVAELPTSGRRDLFEASRERLLEGGVAAVSLSQSGDLREMVGEFEAVFPDASLWEIVPGERYLLVGRRGAESADVTLAERLRRGSGSADVASRLERSGVQDLDRLLGRLVSTELAIDRAEAASGALAARLTDSEDATK